LARPTSTPAAESSSAERVREIVSRYPTGRASLIPILQDLQDAFGYLFPAATGEVSRLLGVSENEIYGVATFYTQFRFHPPGEHTVSVCQGTACHVRGGAQILAELERRLDIRAGQTTADGRFGLERVACVGCCGLAPVVVVDEAVQSRMTVQKITRVLKKYQNQKPAKEKTVEAP
jgi:NADH-quinone oxidoreductase subunit E